jgi:hypothetical protein
MVIIIINAFILLIENIACIDHSVRRSTTRPLSRICV